MGTSRSFKPSRPATALQWLFSYGPAQRLRSAVGRWQEATGYFWILVGTVVMVGSLVPPLLIPFVGVRLDQQIGWSWRPENGFNYASLYGFDGAFRIGFMYVVIGRAEVEAFLFSTIFMRFLIIGPFVAALAWLGVLFLGVASLIVFVDILTPIVALLAWDHSRYSERYRVDHPDKAWWAVWLSVPQHHYERTRISYIIEYESVLQSAYFLVCMIFPSITYAAHGFFEPRFELGMLSATAGLLFVTVGLTPIVIMRTGGMYGGRGIWAARYVIWSRWLSLTCGMALCAIGLIPWSAWLILHWVNMLGLVTISVLYARETEHDNHLAQPVTAE